MKTKLISVLSVLLLCGCAPTINQGYTVKSCEIRNEKPPYLYTIEVYQTGRHMGKFGDGAQRFYSNTPFNVGGNYILRMDEVK